MIKIYVCSNSKLEGVEGCVAQTIVEERDTGSQRWFGWTEPSVLSFCMLCYSMLCNTLVGDLECVLVMLERSPPHLFLYLFYLIKKNKKETKKGSTNRNTSEPKFYYYYYYLFVYYFIYIYLFYFICSPNFLSFSKTQTRPMVKMQCNSILDLSPSCITSIVFWK